MVMKPDGEKTWIVMLRNWLPFIQHETRALPAVSRAPPPRCDSSCRATIFCRTWGRTIRKPLRSAHGQHQHPNNMTSVGTVGKSDKVIAGVEPSPSLRPASWQEERRQPPQGPGGLPDDRLLAVKAANSSHPSALSFSC